MRKYWKVEFLRKESNFSHRIVLCCLIGVLITWLPPVVFSLFEGVFFDHENKTGLIKSFLFHLRFLLVIPFLIISEVLATKVILDKIKFIDISNLLANEDIPEFNEILNRAATLVNSFWTQIIVIALILGFRFYEHQEFSIVCDSWMVKSCSGNKIDWTYAGLWRNWISNTMFLYLFYRNILLIVAWSYIINGFRKLKLHLSAIHPDRFGGLGFLCELPFPFMTMTFTFSSIVVSGIAGRMIYFGNDISIYYPVCFALLFLVIFIHILPTLSLMAPLFKCKLQQRKEFSSLILSHHEHLYNKWIIDNPNNKSILGNPDPSSAADSNTYFEALVKMKIIPINLKSLIFVSLFSMLPLVSIFFIKYDIQQIVKFLVKMLMGSGLV